jgi:hypothetical protein
MVGGVNVPETIKVEGQELHLNGAGLRQVPILGIEIYVAALYLERPSHDPAAILDDPGHKAVVLFFMHGASKEDVQADFRKGERINCGDGRCDPAALPNFERLIQATPAIKRGDTAMYVYDPNRLLVYANDRLIGDYPDGPLSHQLLLGFLGDHPPTERLKRQMLGLATD